MASSLCLSELWYMGIEELEVGQNANGDCQCVKL